MIWPMTEAIYWFWCRWRGHGLFPVVLQVMHKGHASLSFRICWGCDRVYEQDAARALDKIETDTSHLPDSDTGYP